MTFKDRYDQETTWQGKATVMEIYHFAMTSRIEGWTVTLTAEHFQCSIGLVSENLRLARAMHYDDKITDTPTRQEALKKLNGRT